MGEALENITDVPGVTVGMVSDPVAMTGCTVVLVEGGAIAGVEVCGAAPGSRETDLIRSRHKEVEVHAVVLSGGSAFGLDAATGVVRYLEERGLGRDVGPAVVPIVPSAIIFDLRVGDPRRRPDAAMGYRACLSARKGKIPEGNAGAGTGATTGKALGIERCMKGGQGSASLSLPNGVTIGVLVVVNAFGDVYDLHGRQLTGPRDPSGCGLLRTVDIFERMDEYREWYSQNTTLAVVATDALLDKDAANQVARMAANGLSRTIFPFNTMVDGDTVFALSTGKKQAQVDHIGAVAAELLSRSVIRAVKAARLLGGVPAWWEMQGKI